MYLFNVIKRFSGLLIIILLVVINAVLIEMLLDRFGVEGHRFYTGILGVGLVVVSFGYSLRKRRLLPGAPLLWLFVHEWLTIIGTFVLLVHTGTHFRAIVPVLTLVLLFVTFVSGLVGRYVYNNSRAELRAQRAALKERGLADAEIDTELWGLAVASEALSKWRYLHRPIVFLLVVMVLLHTTTVLFFRGL